MPNLEFEYVNKLSLYEPACLLVAASPRCGLDTETYTLPQSNNHCYAAAELRTNPILSKEQAPV